MNWSNRGLLLAALLALPAMARAQMSPEQTLKTFKVADGLQVSLFASEPMFTNPTCMDVDSLGRVWVCESVNYRSKLRNRPLLRPEGDRIVVLVDENADGVADSAKTFYQSAELLAPLGIAVNPDASGPGLTVFVAQSPVIWKFRDANGDLQADGPPEVLLKGFNGIDHDHGVHGLLIGPDAKLYFTVGDSGVTNLQSRDGKGPKWSTNSTDCRAATVWRCNLDGTDLELIAHNFRNNYEPAVDSNGTVFLSDNDDDGNQQTRICHVLPGGNYGYHPRGPGQTHWHEEQPGIVHKVLRTFFGSPTGMCFYEGTLLPEKYRGMPLHTDAGPKHLRCYHLKTNGAGYEATQEVMLESTDGWFRPSDVCVAPDGSLLVADWYDPGVGGHGMGDTTRGRIYRITPKGHTGYTIPKMELQSAEGLAAALTSPNLSMRSAAQSAMIAMPKADAVKQLTAWSNGNDPILRARALWLMPYVTDRATWTAKAVELATKSSDPASNILGLRMLDSFSPPKESGSALALDDRTVRQLESASAPEVRRELMLLARKLPAQQVQPAFYSVAKQFDGKDHFYLAAMNIALGTQADRRSQLLTAFGDTFSTWNDSIAKMVFEFRPASILPKLEASLTNSALLPSARMQIVDILASSDDLNAGKTLLSQLRSTEKLDEIQTQIVAKLTLFLPGKWAGLNRSDELSAVVKNLLNHPATLEAGLELVAAAEMVSRVGTVSEMAENAKLPRDIRTSAIRTLGKLPHADAVAVLTRMAIQSPEWATVAVKSLAGQVPMYGEKAATGAALKSLQELAVASKIAVETRLAAVEALTASNAGSKWLLEAKSKDSLPKELIADAGRFLRNSPFQAIRNQAVIAFPAPGKMDPKQLPTIAELARRKGDAGRGQKLLLASLKNESQCLKCHMVQGQGGQIGPDLSMIGKKATRENLLESILMPSKAIADQFVQYTVETVNGQVISGMAVAESETALTLRDANGRDTVIALKDIEERKKLTTSLMPENLVATLTPDELIDLVEYLGTLKTASLTPDSYAILGPFPSGPDNAGLDVKFAPERTENLEFAATVPGKSGSIQWRTIRASEGAYFDLAKFHGEAGNNSLSYMLRDVESAIDQPATLLLGSDDGAKVFVNGQMVHSNRDTRAAAPAQNSIPITLKKGSNRILVKVANGNNPHGFYLTLTAAEPLTALPLPPTK
ncbi:PVC-type heme-binding CxxCH protein [Tuwongella immobilis]|uniref:Cytochrome c domain-containing protein n=1 Tax=Tuwongella immobilis TaxID=692036 RepID=A0A6C2YS02_9BACT|nr:PVC-type heme-binding CxxCH protein [Tuwongella immobilis]VIP04438.1 membrane-bound dehydrogenase domain protein : Membrane-bound dehydrogenase domain protein OS=Fibrisoma limi BUZ 3 GN=BN8_00269 PE=4 SV=1: GSDH: Cytochrom_C [Tuwongella immobilis]VTS06238.1 membrane-bound dehydrogenase domain protein : Membrane-bound dehydrogenase domain protein OS=Fibrisoma limi BUZ 3 GN=BN8_00269 PE=4 SV=1: GSDH: Cytochrom_C [Tuwongella immobilis]